MKNPTLGNLEIYLRDVNKSIEFKETMDNVELVTQVEFSGSHQFMDIHVIVRKSYIKIQSLGPSFHHY